MTEKTYGYARVSAKDQHADRQLEALIHYGIPRSAILVDKQSGKDFNRPEYQRLLKKLQAKDVLVVKSIDRLGRDYQEIIEQWRFLTREKQVDIVVMDMPLLDTRQGKDLIGTLISDIVLQLLSFVAQSERENIRQRQAEGIEVARQRGVRFGRPPKELPMNFEMIAGRWREKELTSKQAADLLGICERTFFRRIKITEPGGICDQT